MTYEETIEYLYKSLPMYQRIGSAAYKADLENAYEMDKMSGQPHKSFKTIHVAGTNGKGSVSHMLASIYQKAGLKTGLYTSPHLLDFRERIKINGRPVSKEYVVKFIQRNQCFYEIIKPSFFEMTVFMALCYFKTEKVDIAIIETGLGGRLDTTNIISPIASVITNIGFDHTQLLGNSLKEIAREKAGIIKPGIPVIIGETDEIPSNIFNARACLMEAPIYYADDEYNHEFSTRTTHNTINHHFSNYDIKLEIETDLLGMYQYKNIRTALKALEVTNALISVPAEAISEGLKTVRASTEFIGRWHEVAFNPLTVCDIAHNKEGLTEIIEQLKNTAYKKLHIILGFVNDKNIENILQIFPQKAMYYFTRSTVPRSADPNYIHDLAEQYGLFGEVFFKVEDAYHRARENAESEDLIFVGGSTFVVADFLDCEKN
jgi:dihydrofolate synthase / folylpolyglutamate synthase